MQLHGKQRGLKFQARGRRVESIFGCLLKCQTQVGPPCSALPVLTGSGNPDTGGDVVSTAGAALPPPPGMVLIASGRGHLRSTFQHLQYSPQTVPPVATLVDARDCTWDVLCVCVARTVPLTSSLPFKSHITLISGTVIRVSGFLSSILRIRSLTSSLTHGLEERDINRFVIRTE